MKTLYVSLVLIILFTSSGMAQEDNADITGTWVDVKNKMKNRFIFTDDGYAITVVNGDSAGGAPERNRGRYLGYEVKKGANYYTIDLIGGKVTGGTKTETHRVKGIFIYLNNGDMRLCLHLDPRLPRPTAFEKKNTVILTKQE